VSTTAILGGRVLTLDDDRRVLDDGVVVIEDEHLVSIGEDRGVADGVDEVIDARGMAVIPGLINAHTHVPQILLRGGGSQDRDLFDWLFNVLYPGLALYSSADLEVATLLYCTEALLHGVTTIVDNEDAGWGRYASCADAAVRSFLRSGIRAIYAKMYADGGATGADAFYDAVMAKEPGVTHVDIVEPLDQIVSQLEAVHRAHHGAAGRVSVWPSPLTPLANSIEALRVGQRLAAEWSTSWACHVDESRLERSILEMSSTEFLERHQLLDSSLLAAHCVHSTSRDVRLLASRGVRVSTQPVSNSYLGSGVAPVTEFLARDMAVGIGTDDGCCNDSVNLLADMKVLACLHRAVHEDASVLTAERVVEMATLGGAAAVGMLDRIGSLEVGKLADVVLVDLQRPQLVPAPDLAAALVWQANGSEVDTVLVHGEVRVRHGRPTFLNDDELSELYRDANERAASITRRAGIVTNRPWRRVGR
jgi:atrazine chlorohydrolase/5-methylthioadenosine/S-adenosylhomocysteine deaminase/melamine deaminase